uniref:Disease resistance N-terminal domain-containing protein n=1 Tax=Fagus sylvatica TaxID=28930 RepID=A0A2N9F1T7_FAGSY
MAESVVSGVVSRLGDLLLQEANLLVRYARQEESETVRQWVSEIREVAYDADDIIGTYALTVASRKGRRHKEGPQEKRKAIELLPYVVWVVWVRPLLPRWFITITKSSSTLTAALGYLSLNNVKEEMFGKEFCLAFSLHLKRQRDEIRKKRDE